MFVKAKSKSEPTVKASFIVAAEIAKSARPFNEESLSKKFMVKVNYIACPDRQQEFLNVSLSRNTMAEHVCELSTTLHQQLIQKEKISLHTPLLLMRAQQHI